jgi:hypothetical protein
MIMLRIIKRLIPIILCMYISHKLVCYVHTYVKNIVLPQKLLSRICELTNGKTLSRALNSIMTNNLCFNPYLLFACDQHESEVEK